MNKLTKNIIAILIICTILILFINIKSQAAFQANPNTGLASNFETFLNRNKENGVCKWSIRA